MTWILEDFFSQINYEYDDMYFSMFKSEILKWKSLLIKTMTSDKEDEVNLLFVITKLIETRSYIEDSFSDLIKILLDDQIISKDGINSFKKSEPDKRGYKTYLEGFIVVDDEVFSRLVKLIN